MGSAPKSTPPSDMTTDEFIKWPGDGTSRKYQLVDGDVRAMSPASSTHGVIQATVAYLLRRHIEAHGLPCVVATEPPVIPRVGAKNNVRAPDLGVSCSKSADSEYALTDPVLLIEILSPSNKAETWTNVWAFTTIPSVMEIVVVNSTIIEAKLLTRLDDGSWPEMPKKLGKSSQMKLTSLDLKIALAKLYAGTKLAA